MACKVPSYSNCSLMDPLLDLFDAGESSPRPAMPSSLPPEVEEGNVEYKLKLLSPSASRFEHLVTQMKWRLKEGQGEAIYEIGVSNSGTMCGLSEGDMQDSLSTLKRMAVRLGASASVLRRSVVGEGEEGERRCVTEVLVRKVPDDQQFLDIRLAVVGPMDAGKSTLLGVLTHQELDNGRGKARLNLFRHLHEIQSGRTSSISHEILGFNSKGEVVNYSQCTSAEEICEASSKLITLIDLAGHQKYLRTTVFGLTACCPDFAMLVVGANSGVVGTTCEHLGYAVALDVPTFVVVTKIDLCHKTQVESTVKQLKKVLENPGCCKIPYMVENESDACLAAQRFTNKSIAPIFLVSSVTGENLHLLQKFLNLVPPLRSRRELEKLEQHHLEFQVDEVYSVPDAGTVVGGILKRGVVREGDQVVLGPRDDGTFSESLVGSIRRNKVPCRVVRAGQAATIALAQVERAEARKGSVLLSHSVKNPTCCWEFEAEVFLLYVAGTPIKVGFQATVYIGSTMQNAVVKEVMKKDQLVQGEKGYVRFRFLRCPEFLHVQTRVLFREGRTKGIGTVTRTLPEDTENNNRTATATNNNQQKNVADR